MRQLTQEYVQELFEYRDGKLYWKMDRGTHKLKGKRAGSINTRSGYRRVSINHYPYLEHRVIWLYHYGNVPDCLDHIDGNPLNNTIENLRSASFSQNMYNRKTNKDNKSGIKGVRFFAPRNKWIARIRQKDKHLFLKYYDTLEEAKQAIEEARANLHKEFARHG